MQRIITFQHMSRVFQFQLLGKVAPRYFTYEITATHILKRCGAGTKLAVAYSSGNVTNSSLRKEVYAPKGVFLHAVLLRQPFGHCERFLTAASRRSLDSVSVPVRRATLLRPLLVIALVSFYLTNKLISHRPLPSRRTFTIKLSCVRLMDYQGLSPFSWGYT